MRISDWSSDVCSSDLRQAQGERINVKSSYSKQPRRDICVDFGQPVEIGDRDGLVELVHRRVDQPEFRRRAERREEARVRGAARGRELGARQIGTASCRERGGRVWLFSVVAIYLKKAKNTHN